MTSTMSLLLTALCFAYLISTTPTPKHQASNDTLPEGSQARVEQASMMPDQGNTTEWNRAWTNLLNDAEQSFTPSLPRLLGVEVELVVANAGAAEDDLTLTVLDATGQSIAIVTKTVQTGTCGHVMFLIPKGKVGVTPGQTYRLRLSGGTLFGWKYVVDGYRKGAATFNGKPLLAQARSTFLFRTFGAK